MSTPFASPHLPRRVWMLAGLLPLLGFVVGYGAGVGVRRASVPGVTPSPTPPGEDESVPPIAKSLRVSPDDRLLSFTAVYDQSRRASRFLLDLQSGRFDAAESPRGWQDYITQWSADGRALLFEREKIPRPVADATPGFYRESVQPGSVAGSPAGPQRSEPQLLTKRAPPNEKIIAGLWTPNGQLVLKTRREPKALYEVRNGQTHLIDRAAVTYLQNRAVLENGKLAFYVVRDPANDPQAAALFRVQDGKARQLSPPLRDVTWVYVAENARWMIVCRQAANDEDWMWTLYRVSPQGVQQVTENIVPGDVIAVYWSPDFKRVLGASGKSLWLVDVPSLQVHQLGPRTDWNADDAAWLAHRSTVIVAANGRLWQVEVPSGTARELWKFPADYWQ